MKNYIKIYLPALIFLITLASCKQQVKNSDKANKTMEETSILSGIENSNFNDSIDGKPVSLYVLKNKNGLEVTFTDFGQRLISLMAPDKNGKLEDIVLGYSTLKEYATNGGYFGAIIGRYGNRIGKGRFELDGTTYELAKNNNGNHLHGGLKAFESVMWNVDSVSQDYIRFSRISPDMEEGYPGNLEVAVEYTLTDSNELRIEYSATTDKKTPINLTHHSFFNLKGAGNGNVNDHMVQINSNHITPVDDGLIPTGEFMPVAGTPFDFNTAKTVQEGLDGDHEQLTLGMGFDHNFVLDTGIKNAEGLLIAAKVVEPQSGRTMEVFTNEPGVQFYGGNFLDGSTGKNGKSYVRRGALCLETQHYPDSPNRDNFPSTILEPGQEYKSICVYKFSVE